jgi:LysM repeat protein
MNNPNPFVPQGSLMEQKNKKRARVKVAVYSIFAINILVISPLLIQGCKKEAPAADTSALPSSDTTTNPTPDTNLPPVPMTNTMPALASNTPPPAPLPVPPAPAPIVPEVPAGQDYVVAKGDSFYSIAKKFHVKIKDIESANPGVTPAKLKVGQKLQVPGASSSTSAGTAMGAAADTSSGGSETVVTVKPGDSLMKIAHEHGSTIRLIKSANDLKTDRIKVGQKLKVPAKAASATEAASAPVAPAPAPMVAPSAVPPMPPPSVPANGAAR